MDVEFCGDDNDEKTESKNVSKSVIINHYGTAGRPMIADRWAMIERISDARVAKVSIHYVFLVLLVSCTLDECFHVSIAVPASLWLCTIPCADI